MFSIRANFYESILAGNTVGRPRYIPSNVNRVLTELSFENRATGGYWSANISFVATLEQAKQWMNDGIGRHVAIWGDGYDPLWEGFVNEVEFTTASLRATRFGPLTDVGNRVRAVYQKKEYTLSLNVTYTRTLTSPISDARSIQKWGTWDTILTAGRTNADMATQYANRFLESNREPRRSGDISLQLQSDQILITASCLGYVHRLRHNYPTADTSTGEIDVAQKIRNLLAEQPESLFSAANIRNIGVNTPAEVDDEETIWEQIKGVTALGGSGYETTIFGIGPGRVAYFEPVSNDIPYRYSVFDQTQQVRNRIGATIRPYSVKAGRRLLPLDLVNVGSGNAIFIEAMSYMAPLGLELRSDELTTLGQFVAQNIEAMS